MNKELIVLDLLERGRKLKEKFVKPNHVELLLTPLANKYGVGIFTIIVSILAYSFNPLAVEVGRANQKSPSSLPPRGKNRVDFKLRRIEHTRPA